MGFAHIGTSAEIIRIEGDKATIQVYEEVRTTSNQSSSYWSLIHQWRGILYRPQA